jgi:hypothetical protein
MRLFIGFHLLVAAILVPANLAQAVFHLMKIEQIIGGVNGDTTAQAIQLRLRAVGENFVSQTRLTAVDATGSNLVLLDDMTTDVSVGTAGARILIATPSFLNYTNVPITPDFIMDPIPASYLAAGQVRYTNDAGSLRYWLLSWGNYTGIQTGTPDNDANGNFSPPVSFALPSTSLQALRFTRSTAANALSVTNAGDYTLTSSASDWINNAGATVTLVTPPPPGLPGDYNNDGTVNAADYTLWRDHLGQTFILTNENPAAATPGVVDAEDYAFWKSRFGQTSGSGSGANANAIVPEPITSVLIILGAMASITLRAPRASTTGANTGDSHLSRRRQNSFREPLARYVYICTVTPSGPKVRRYVAAGSRAWRRRRRQAAAGWPKILVEIGPPPVLGKSW